MTTTAAVREGSLLPERSEVKDPDRPLLERALAGEREAFDDLIRKYQHDIYRFVFSYAKDHDAAADLVQNTFVKVLKQLKTFRGTGSFRTWLYRIAANLSKNHLRDTARWRKTDLDKAHLSEQPKGISGMVAEQEREVLRRALEQLPPKQRLTVELRIYSDLPFKEVAETMGCTVGTAKVNFHYALKNLRKKIGPDGLKELSFTPKSSRQSQHDSSGQGKRANR